MSPKHFATKQSYLAVTNFQRVFFLKKIILKKWLFFLPSILLFVMLFWELFSSSSSFSWFWVLMGRLGHFEPPAPPTTPPQKNSKNHNHSMMLFFLENIHNLTLWIFKKPKRKRKHKKPKNTQKHKNKKNLWVSFSALLHVWQHVCYTV